MAAGLQRRPGWEGSQWELRLSPGVPVVTRPEMQTGGSLHGSPNVPRVCIHRLIKARRRVQAGPETDSLVRSQGPRPLPASGACGSQRPLPWGCSCSTSVSCWVQGEGAPAAAAHSPAADSPPRPCNSSSGSGPALPTSPSAPTPPPMHSSPPGSREDFREPVFWKDRGSSWKWCKTVTRHRGSAGRAEVRRGPQILHWRAAPLATLPQGRPRPSLPPVPASEDYSFFFWPRPKAGS